MPRKAKQADSPNSEAVENVLAHAPQAAAEGADVTAPIGGINEKIRQLIRLSKEQGYLTFDDINEALPESIENQEEIDNVLSILQNLEIEILEPDQVEDYKQRQEEAEEEESRSSQNDILDDPVRMYLKGAGGRDLQAHRECGAEGAGGAVPGIGGGRIHRRPRREAPQPRGAV
jgi:RNA polymerase primary sigma factor